MKKLIIAVVASVFLFGGVAHAQVPNQQELQTQLDRLVLILNLMRQIEALQAQLAALQARQIVTPAPLIQPVVEVPAPTPSAQSVSQCREGYAWDGKKCQWEGLKCKENQYPLRDSNGRAYQCVNR